MEGGRETGEAFLSCRKLTLSKGRAKPHERC